MLHQRLKKNLKICLTQFQPESSGIAVAIIGSSLALCGIISIDKVSLSTFSSVVTQILATYSGLVLTAYTVLHGMKINSSDYRIERTKNLTTSQQSQIEELMNSVHDLFRQSIWILSAATISACFVYLVTLLKTPLEPWWLKADSINASGASILFGFVVTGTLNVVYAVHALFDLRDL